MTFFRAMSTELSSKEAILAHFYETLKVKTHSPRSAKTLAHLSAISCFVHLDSGDILLQVGTLCPVHRAPTHPQG